MCCRTVFQGQTYKPGDLLPVKSAAKAGVARWEGFARQETYEAVWGTTYDVRLDILADGFAEKNKDLTRFFGYAIETEAPIPPGHVIFGVGNRFSRSVKILTREATEEEKEHFGHHRLPVIGPARFGGQDETK